MDKYRFIPTPAGNSPLLQTFPMRLPVHPHTRGELSESSRAGKAVFGSSPHPRVLG